MQYYMRIVLGIFLLLFTGIGTGAAAQEIFGPVKYDVKDRYGKLNHYTAKVPAKDGVYVIKLQIGATAGEKPDWMDFSVNGVKVLRSDKYAYSFVAVFVPLKSENTLDLVMRDEYPSGLKRPPLGPRNVTVSVLPAPAKSAFMRTAMGLSDWNSLGTVIGLFSRLSAQSAQFALDAVNCEYEMPRRLDSLRKLSGLREKAAEDVLEWIYVDPIMSPQLRGAAAIALGGIQDKRLVPLFMRGLLDPEIEVGIASASALALYPEADTQELLSKTLGQLDSLRKDAAIQTITKGGWKPVSSMTALVESPDPQTAELALAVLGGMQDRRATEYLLASLADPARGHKGGVIQALGATKDPRAVDALLAFAADKAKRKGLEADLAEALSRLGDKRAAGPIEAMAKDVTSSYQLGRMQAAYDRLTGAAQ